MRLGQLTGLEREKIESELKELAAAIAEFKEILADQGRILTIVKEEALRLQDRYTDERRTEITMVTGEVDVEDLIPVEDCVMTLTRMGYVKRLPADTYRAQRRGGRGISGMTTRDEDFAQYMFICSSHDYIMFFTNLGRVYRLKAYEVPEGSRTSKGLNIVNILPLAEDEKVTAMIKVPAYEDDKFLCMVTRNGIIKRTALSAYDSARKAGLIAIAIDEGDELRWVEMTDGDSNLLVGTKLGKAIRFNEQDARVLSRTARGVKCISMDSGDEVVGMSAVNDETTILTVTDTGYGRRSSTGEYRLQHRGGKGIINYKIAYGNVAAITAVADDEDIIMISDDGVVIRVAANEISEYARTAKGVRVMRVGQGSRLVTVSAVPHEEFDDSEESEGESEE